ncbi:unnamed protein product [Cochlearia groenlandica]
MNMAKEDCVGVRLHQRVAIRYSGYVTAWLLSVIVVVFVSAASMIAFMTLQSDDFKFQVNQSELTRFDLDG